MPNSSRGWMRYDREDKNSGREFDPAGAILTAYSTALPVVVTLPLD